MAVTVQMQFESAVTEIYQDAFVGSAIEKGAMMITFRTSRTHSHKPLNLLVISFLEHIDLKNN